MADKATQMIVFYDGLCGFCDRTVQYILERDRGKNHFLFAPLQSSLANEILPKHGKNPKDLNTLYLLLDRGLPTERVLQKSSAAARIGKALGGGSAVMGFLTALLPRFLRDWGYDRVAKARYRIFGKLDTCRIPPPGDRTKFIGL